MRRMLTFVLAAACMLQLVGCAITSASGAGETAEQSGAGMGASIENTAAAALPEGESQDAAGTASAGENGSYVDFAKAVPAAQEFVPYPREEDYTNPETWEIDYEGLRADYELWKAQQQVRIEAAGMEESALVEYFREMVPALLVNEEGENRIASPVNLWLALAMFAEVVDGESRQQLLDLMAVETIEEAREQAGYILTANYYDDGTTASLLGSSLWLRDGYGYHDDTLEKLAQAYAAYVFSGEMGSDEYNAALQAWINDNTGNMLTEQASGLEMSPDTVLALVTTIYLKAAWAVPFEEYFTKEDVFHAKSEDMTCDFMHSSDFGTYYVGDGFGAVLVPIRNSGEMWILLPDEGVSPEEILADGRAMDTLLGAREWSETRYADINLALPKFDASSDIDLIEILEGLGVTDIFDGAVSDFSPLTDEKGLAVTTAKHAARAAVNENGITAAAYTILAVNETAVEGGTETIDFIVDRPFIFCVMGLDGQPTFVGLVNTPVE